MTNPAQNIQPAQTIQPAMELRGVSVNFGSVRALQDIDIKVYPGEVHCLLGDNGAGKSTLIKVLSGVHRPTKGEIFVDGKPVAFRSPRDAQDLGVATVFQDLGMISLMSITRNFFLGREPTKSSLPFSRIDKDRANTIARQAMADIGIDVRDPTQAVGTLSGGERQSVAIARAVHFGAKVLILDEPTSALGVHQAAMVLKFIIEARMRGLAVIFISHNIHHAYPVGDTFTLLNRGRNRGTYAKSDISRDEVISIMSGGEDLKAVEAEIAGLLAQIGNRPSAPGP
ncbi:ATP-binding cassette domain-containing protein [Mesorhizobium sp. PL10]